MGDDRSVIFNAASALFSLGEFDDAQRVFSKFPITAPLPGDMASHDLFAKAHWLAAGLLTKKSPLDCGHINAEVETALLISPTLKGPIAADKSLRVCDDAHGGKK